MLRLKSYIDDRTRTIVEEAEGQVDHPPLKIYTHTIKITTSTHGGRIDVQVPRPVVQNADPHLF